MFHSSWEFTSDVARLYVVGKYTQSHNDRLAKAIDITNKQTTFHLNNISTDKRLFKHVFLYQLYHWYPHIY